MSADEVASLRRSLENLEEHVSGMDAKLDIIHTAVVGLAGRAYVPGPSIWRRMASFLGLLHL